MNPEELQNLALGELLKLHGAVQVELRRREICRTENGPTADYAEYLVGHKLGIKLNGNSALGCDGIDTSGTRFQIKGRRINPKNRSTQLSAIRNLALNEFDFLIGVLFDEFYCVSQVAKVPHAVVTEHAVYRAHQNGHILHLNKRLFADERVEDMTQRFLPV